MTDVRPGLAPGKEITKAVSLIEPLGSGGMGAVWLANHLGLKTRVVVKFMLVGMDSSETARMRFSREAAAAAQVKSPHVVQMLDHGVSDDGVPFIVMEHLEGHDLGEEIEKHGALDPAMVVGIVSQVAKALSKVHAADLLHRDIKPDNIFLVEGEEELFVKLLDFGIAKSSTMSSDQDSLDGGTKTGQIVGTPFYMSPEQVTAQKTIDHRSDLWALGVVAYEAMTGTRPYDGPSFGALAVKIATGSATPPSAVNPSLPPAVDEWFARACARAPAERFGSARELADAFRVAFEGLVSLPISQGDSGARSGPAAAARPASRPESGENSGPRTGPSPTLGLAATALDESDDARRRRQRSPLRYVAGAMAVLVAVLIAVVFGRKPVPLPAPSAPIAVVSTTPLVSSTLAIASSAPVVVATAAPAAPDAGTPTIAAHPTTKKPPVAPPVTKPSVNPPPTAKPTSSEPDLF